MLDRREFRVRVERRFGIHGREWREGVDEEIQRLANRQRIHSARSTMPATRIWPSSRGASLATKEPLTTRLRSAYDPLLLAHRPSIRPFLAVIQRSVFCDEGSADDPLLLALPSKHPTVFGRHPEERFSRRRISLRCQQARPPTVNSAAPAASCAAPPSAFPKKSIHLRSRARSADAYHRLPPTQPRRSGIS